MSIKENDVWLEYAMDNFDTAIEQGNYLMAKAVIEDVQNRGFAKEAGILQKVLELVPVSKFAITSPYANL